MGGGGSVRDSFYALQCTSAVHRSLIVIVILACIRKIDTEPQNRTQKQRRAASRTHARNFVPNLRERERGMVLLGRDIKVPDVCTCAARGFD